MFRCYSAETDTLCVLTESDDCLTRKMTEADTACLTVALETAPNVYTYAYLTMVVDAYLSARRHVLTWLMMLILGCGNATKHIAAKTLTIAEYPTSCGRNQYQETYGLVPEGL